MSADNEFLSEWAAGDNKDYRDNIAYYVGENVRIPWELAVTNATLRLWQDNFPSSAQGGPDVLIASKFMSFTYSWLSIRKVRLLWAYQN